jgi:flavorubredoxin
MGSPKCKEGLEKHYFGNWDFNVVKTGDEVKLGKKTLKFIEAPMLHWPDSMFTYIPEDGLLLPNDAFGQHYATSRRFDDEVSEAELMDEAEKYYANILWPFSGLIIRKIEELQKMNVPLNIIAPSHGVIWRKDPGRIIKAYLKWANNTTRDKAVVAYETMWGATETMARLIAEGLSDSGIEVKLYDVVLSDRTEIITTMMDARAFVLGSSTHDNDMLSGMAGFLMFLKGLRPKGRIGFAFGSFGWAGGGAESVEKGMKEAAVELVKPVLTVKYIPDEKEKAACYEYGKELAKMIIERRK